MKTTLIGGASTLAAALLLTAVAHAAEMLAAKDGMTLYTFDKDVGGVSACYGDCATNWPPYLGKEGDTMMKDWALAKRTDGTMQWTYDAKPLYFFIGDKAKGDAKGDGLKGVWHVIKE